MQHFIISFQYLGKWHSAKVQKINISPMRFVVYDVYPLISKLPGRLVFVSNEKDDQLIYKSFKTDQDKVIRQIGEMVFRTCDSQRIGVHD